MYRRLSVSIFGYLAIFPIVTMFAMSAYAVENIKVSKLNGGEQYWWEAEDFDSRDETVMLLNDEPDHGVPDLPGAFGDKYMIHNAANKTTPVEGSHFIGYEINIKKGGTYYVWVRVSFSRAAGARVHNSAFLQVNDEPAIAAFDRYGNGLGDATWPADIPEDNPWVWAGHANQPAVGDPAQGLSNGLAFDFVAGENTVNIYHREGGAGAPDAWCDDVLMISTVDFVPTDADYEGASTSPVEPMGRLTTTWGQIK